MKVLNLYAGIGGNRKLWPKKYKVTAVETNTEIAEIYKDYFPLDTVIIDDAKQYLLQHYHEFDFIWASPECTTHTSLNINFNLVRYPDLSLYQIIIFLKHWFKGKWVVENVKPYYTPLIPGQIVGRHMFWSNFNIPKSIYLPDNKPNKRTSSSKRKRKNYDGNIVNIKPTDKHFGFDLTPYKLKTRKDKILRNCVDPSLGKSILELAESIYKDHNSIQTNLFYES